jgi:hypothetical protein
MATTFTGLKPFPLFPVMYLKDKVFQKKSPHTVPELETAIQSEIEAISGETKTEILKSLGLRLHTFMIFEDITPKMY